MYPWDNFIIYFNMLITGILGNIKDIDSMNLNIDYVHIEWFNTQKRIARYVTQNNVDIALKFENVLRIGLNDGDILSMSENNIIAVSIIPTDIFIIKVKNCLEAAKICYEIGNLHLPLFVGNNEFEFKIPYEKPLQRLLDKLYIHYIRQYGVLDSKDRLNVSFPVIENNLNIANCKVYVRGK